MNEQQDENRKPVSEAIKHLHPSVGKPGGAKEPIRRMGGSSIGSPGGPKKPILRLQGKSRRK